MGKKNERKKFSPEKITAVGAYVSAGGFSRGVQEEANILAHLSDGVFGVESLEHNFPDVPHYHDHDNWPLERLAALEPDLFYCAPPCAPWSRSGGRGLRIAEDPRVEKVGHVIEAGLAIQPKIWIMESVPQMPEWTPEFTQNLVEAWMENGYSVTFFFSNYLLHNTPQNRPRFHFIAHRYQLVFPDLSPGAITCRDVLQDLPPPKKKEIITNRDTTRYDWLLKYTPPGARLRGAYRWLAGMPPGAEGRSGKIGGPPYMLARLRWDAPCLTLVSIPRRYHPDGERLLTVREGMAVCGFNHYPYEFVGATEQEKFKQIAKGVLPPLGHYLAELAARSIREGEVLDTPHHETVDFRPYADRIMKTIPRRPPFDPALFGTMPHFKDPRHRPSEGEDEPEGYEEVPGG